MKNVKNAFFNFKNKNVKTFFITSTHCITSQNTLGCFRADTIFVAVLCTFSKISLSSDRWYSERQMTLTQRMRDSKQLKWLT